jgi:hypothetical protein
MMRRSWEGALIIGRTTKGNFRRHLGLEMVGLLNVYRFATAV